MPKQWFEITVEAPLPFAEAIANFLIESGAPGIQSAETGDRAALVAYFAAEPPLESLAGYCRDLGWSPRHGIDMRVCRINDEDWAHSWQRHSTPVSIGARLYICPSWDAQPPRGRIPVVIDPGMAFGTGQHATTRGCLLLLEQTTRRQTVARALDLGCGSGILAIALAKMGVPEVWAVDSDRLACSVAMENVARNGVAGAVHIAIGLEGTPAGFDVIAANLYADVLEELAPILATALHPGGVLVCSGFLANDEARVRLAYEARTLLTQERRVEESWVTLGLRRPNVA